MQNSGIDGFIGRTKELQIFSDLLDKTSAGIRRNLLISGPPGIGKTYLNEEFRKAALKRGAAVYHSMLNEGARLSGKKFWCNFVPAKPDRTVREKTESCSRLYSRIADTIKLSCNSSPCVIIADNLHLADRHLLAGISDLLDDLNNLPVLFVSTFQDLQVYKTEHFILFLSDLKASSYTAECIISNFSPEEAAILIENSTGIRPPEPFMDNLIKLTGGNPLLIREIALYLSSHGNFSFFNGNAELFWRVIIPKEIGLIISCRLSRISAEALSVLRKGALIGRDFTLKQLLILEKEYPEEFLLLRLQECSDRGFLIFSEKSSEFSFIHTIIHLAVIENIPPSEKIKISARFIETVEKLPAKNRELWNYQLAQWFTLTGNSKSQKKIRYYTKKAADSALRSGCYDEAAELYGRISEKTQKEAGSREDADIFLGLGIAKSKTAQINEAFFYLAKAFAWFSRKSDINKIVKIASLPDYLYSGYTGFNRYFSKTLEIVPEDSVTQAALLLYYGMTLIIGTGEYKNAEKFLYRSLDLGKRYSDKGITSRSLVFLSVIDYTYCRFTEAGKKLYEAEVLSSESGDSGIMAEIIYGKSLLMLESGKYYEALLNLEAVFTLSRNCCDNIKKGITFYLKARLNFQVGRWEEARQLTDQGLMICRDHLYLLFHRAAFEYSLGEIESGDSYSRKLHALKRRTPAGPYMVHIYSNALILIRARCSGDYSGIKKIIPELELIEAHVSAHPFIRLRAHLLSAAAGVFTGDILSVRRNYEALRKFQNLHLIRPYLLERVLGLTAGALGDLNASCKHFTSAIKSAERYNDIFMTAWIHYDFAVSWGLSVNGDDTCIKEGREDCVSMRNFHLQAALETAESIGLKNLSAFSLREFENTPAGKTLIKKNGKLTKRENQVLTLLSAGLTNGNIASELNISIFTVANHIHHILEKTGASNRTEASALARIKNS